MSSKVYFIDVNNSDKISGVKLKLARLLQESRVLDFIRKGDRVAIKMHFGEEGNKGYVNPEYVAVVCDMITRKQATPFLVDTNTLYREKRVNSQEHLELAYAHGFRKDVLGAEVLIPDDTKRDNCIDIEINQQFIKSAKMVKVFWEADAIIGIAHFKGHLMTGFGGALKNVGMGCANREGKLAQHSDISPIVHIDKCVGCGSCEKVCPVQAITIKNKKSHINSFLCIGCASCIAACNSLAMDVDWEKGESAIQEKMVEYAKAVLDSKKNKVAFINFALKITKQCDCIAKDDPRIVSDVGILASFDPVSIDKASWDLINQASGRDIFKEVWPNRDGFRQLHYASQLGLGSLDYELCR